MSRSSGLLVLAACVTVLVGAFLATASSIALGAWTPLGERPAPTSTPQSGGPIGGPGEVTYERFLADVQSGDVQHVDFVEGERLDVSTNEAFYQLVLPDGVTDPFADMTTAAAQGSVRVPTFTVNGAQEDLGERTYEQMLDDVAAGRLYDVSQTDRQLSCSGALGFYLVLLEDPEADVLGDIEAAAADGGVPAPSYSKYSEG
jgi:hypothetical protein